MEGSNRSVLLPISISLQNMNQPFPTHIYSFQFQEDYQKYHDLLSLYDSLLHLGPILNHWNDSCDSIRFDCYYHSL